MNAEASGLAVQQGPMEGGKRNICNDDDRYSHGVKYGT